MVNNFSNSINSTIGASNSGATNTLTITNPSNTASSQAQEIITVGGATAGDAFTTYTVAGVTNWSQGIDNSVSGDPFVISASTALGTTNTLTIDTLGNTIVFGTTASTPVLLGIDNPDTNAASISYFYAATGATSAADMFVKLGITAGRTYSFGQDVSDSNSLKITTTADGSADPSTGTVILKSSTTGAITLPAQPCFEITQTSAINNVTGDGTAYTILFATTVFDQASNYNSSTGIFTAPVAGRYLFCTSIGLAEIGVAHTGLTLAITATGTSPQVWGVNPAVQVISGFITGGGSAIINMAASDTCKVVLTVFGSTKTVDIAGSPASFFSGCLLA